MPLKTSVVRSWLKHLVVAFTCAGAAERPAVDDHFALEIDAFTAFGAYHARTFESGQVFRLHLDFYPLFVKKNVV
jgi:hypothetical protein